MAATEQQKKIYQLANDVLRLARNTLLVNLRFMDMAISRLIPAQVEEIPFATDGRNLFYEPRHLLHRYKQSQETVARDYLHTVLHCVFCHMFVNPTILSPYWDLACDIAVEYSIASLNLKVASQREQQQEIFLQELQSEIGNLTAEKIYRYYVDKNLSPEDLTKLRTAFEVDDHCLWYTTGDDIKSSSTTPQANNSPDGSQPSSERSGSNPSTHTELPGDAGDSDSPRSDYNDAPQLGTKEDWESIANRIQVDMETFSKQQGDQAGGMMQNLREITREKYDYSAFLKKFAVRAEAMKINNDEFDYIYYTYGLQLYKKIPLIEPLEYKDVKRIREFVIAIDTSGSVAGEQVQSFLQKTYNILQSTESFFSKINVHIIQCDAQIQEDAKITSRDEFGEYLKRMKIRGLGGTDFRPVFSYVDELNSNKEFSNLKGLIYFTDGWGTFPVQKPNYETAFVFVDDGQNNYDVPPWTIKLILQKDEI